MCVGRVEIEVKRLVSRVQVAQVRPSGQVVIRKIESVVIKIRHGYASSATTKMSSH